MSKKQRNSPRFFRIGPDLPETEIIAAAARTLRQGGVVVFPTRSLYGLAADAFNPAAVERVFHIKRRPAEKPLLVLIKSREAVWMLAEEVPPAAEFLMDHFWPGNVTIVVPAGSSVDPILTGGSGKIGVRMPGHPVAAALVNAAGGPITGTSANISGGRGCSTLSDLDTRVAAAAELILDAGPLKPGRGSTVIEVCGEGGRILREGTVSRAAIASVLQSGSFKLIDNSA